MGSKFQQIWTVLKQTLEAPNQRATTWHSVRHPASVYRAPWLAPHHSRHSGDQTVALPFGNLTEEAQCTNIKSTLDYACYCQGVMVQTTRSSTLSENCPCPAPHSGGEKQKERENAAPGNTSRTSFWRAIFCITATALANWCEGTFCMFNYTCWLKDITI